jgi:hypothetical protein
MAKSLNFRNFNQPTFPVTMNDVEETLFTVTTPSVELIERLEANQDMLVSVFKTGDRQSVEEYWKLAADLISCNRERRTTTAEELKGKYGMTYEMLFAFMVGYLEFINEIENAKN